jgi:hypothetical protein
MIFSRRAIQERLNQLRERLQSDEIDSLAKRLNEVGRSRISAMWEVMIISSLLRLGRVEIEPELSSGRRPDILFDDNKGVVFFADITCVSDEGVDKENPIEFFNKCLMESIARLGFPRGGHGCRVESKRITTSRGQKIVLRLPEYSDIPKFISENIEPKLKDQLNTGERYIKILIDDEQAGLSLTIDTVGDQFNSFGHAVYDLPSILDRNPLFNALRAKSKQLKAAEGVKGIIVCDGDSKALSSRSLHNVEDAYLICNEFFRQHRSIDFILIISVEEVRKSPLYVSSMHGVVNAKIASRNGFSQSKEIELVFDSILKDLPKPINSPVNAVHRAKESGYGLGYRGGYRVSGNKIRLSSRAVVEVLSGRKSIGEFNADYDWNGNSSNFQMLNPFEKNLIDGCLPVRVTVEAGDDDDWIEFEFGERDAAVSEFY